jgi:hypothetical protein
MKKFSIVTAIVMFAATTAPAFASCDTRKEDDQAVCALGCEDNYVRHKQDMMADHAKLKADKKACDEKCGCPENSKDL